jgi:hypothetical protein
MFTKLDPNNISGVTVIVNGTAYTYEAHSLNKVAEILGGSQAVQDANINAIAVNYFTTLRSDESVRKYTMLNPSNISGVTVTVNGTAYTYEAHSLNWVASILGDTQALEGAKIDAIAVNYFSA